MNPPLWLDVEPKHTAYDRDPQFTVSLARCRNCGEVKVSSDPCGFDHLAAVMEFRAYLDSVQA